MHGDLETDKTRGKQVNDQPLKRSGFRREDEYDHSQQIRRASAHTETLFDKRAYADGAQERTESIWLNRRG